EMAEVITEAFRRAAVEAGPERRLAQGDAAAVGHALIVVRDARNHVNVRVDVVHGCSSPRLQGRSVDYCPGISPRMQVRLPACGALSVHGSTSVEFLLASPIERDRPEEVGPPDLDLPALQDLISLLADRVSDKAPAAVDLARLHAHVVEQRLDQFDILL